MSLFKAVKKKETLADVHHDQTDNFYDDFVDLSPPEFEFLVGEETQTPAAPTYPAIFNESLISPSTCGGQKTSKMSLRETFQPTQPNSSVETTIRGKATSQTTMLQQQLLRLRQQRRWVLQKRVGVAPAATAAAALLKLSTQTTPAEAASAAVPASDLEPHISDHPAAR